MNLFERKVDNQDDIKESTNSILESALKTEENYVLIEEVDMFDVTALEDIKGAHGNVKKGKKFKIYKVDNDWRMWEGPSRSGAKIKDSQFKK